MLFLWVHFYIIWNSSPNQKSMTIGTPEEQSKRRVGIVLTLDCRSFRWICCHFWRKLLYPRHLCRWVYSLRFSVRMYADGYIVYAFPFVCSLLRSLFRNVRGIYVKVFVKVSLVVYSQTSIKAPPLGVS